MEESKRRKQIDPNYGEPSSEEAFAGMSEPEWRERLGYSDHEWKHIKPYFRVVEKFEDVDGSFDGIWIYKSDVGKETIALTGRFAGGLFGQLKGYISTLRSR
jgi:hypothetical protein